jgi:hypothetical protein
MKNTVGKPTRLQWAEQQANQLIKEFTDKKLIPKGWRFGWRNSIGVFGRCVYRTKTIYLSRPFVRSVKRRSTIISVIYHEIFHILTKGDKHGEKWKNKHLEFGIKPQETYNVHILFPAKYIGSCPDCKKEYRRYRRSRLLDKQLLYCTIETCNKSKPIKWRLST